MKITVDISRKMELAQLDAKISSERKTNLLRFVSHEIRNPITTITGFCEILVKDPSITGEIKEPLNCIYSGAEHIKNIVNDLLAVSKFDSGKITIESKEFELSSWIESFEKILTIRAKLKDINFKIIRKEPFPSKATGDCLKLSQIIINLTENAFKFTPEKGKVTLDLSFSHNLLTIIVKDNGRGIPLNAQKKLFTPFFQVQTSKDYSGLGLGLSICREFVDMMEGTIDFISEEGKGSTFTCQIPLASVK